MGQFYHSNISWRIEPVISSDAKADLNCLPLNLSHFGLNLPITVSPASAQIQMPIKDSNAPAVGVMAHLDTGASRTTISIKLAEFLDLTPTGLVPVITAGGVHKMTTFAIDLYFPSCNLSPILNLPVCSCHLDYDVDNPSSNERRKFAVLIGRGSSLIFRTRYSCPKF